MQIQFLPFPMLFGFVDLQCLVFPSLGPCAMWYFSYLELGRLRNVILVLATDCRVLAQLPTQMQIYWKCSLFEKVLALQKQTNLFFSPLFPIALCFYLKIRQEYHFRNTFHVLKKYSKLTAFDSSPKHPINFMQSSNPLPLHPLMHPMPLGSDAPQSVRWPGEWWLTAMGTTQSMGQMVSQYSQVSDWVTGVHPIPPHPDLCPFAP